VSSGLSDGGGCVIAEEEAYRDWEPNVGHHVGVAGVAGEFC
jgi:hypothetical protein